MAFDDQTRRRLFKTVTACRKLLTEDFDEQLRGRFGIYADEGRVLEIDKLRSLTDTEADTARVLRERISHLAAGGGLTAVKDAVNRILREQAFTVLNRFAALRMAEERGIISQSVGGGLQSKGFRVFEQNAGSALGEQYERYLIYLDCLFDELSLDLGVLFDRSDATGMLFPGEKALRDLFAEVNDSNIAHLWEEDETIGWIYQYYNDPDERKKMRKESQAPRNSRELAVRNQFFTPRYVVEFLTDNTLGRIWYEMTKGRTQVVEQCRYLVRRPSEIFLRSLDVAYRCIYGDDATIPEDLTNTDAYAALYNGNLEPAANGDEGLFPLAAGALSEESFEASVGEPWEQHGNDQIDELRQAIIDGREHPKKDDLVWGWAAVSHYIENSQLGTPYTKESTEKLKAYFRDLLKRHLPDESLDQTELLGQPVLIPHRPIKDPREIRLLDPACGSMHFGLYAFDLFERIYDESWDFAKSAGVAMGADATFPNFVEWVGEFETKESYLKQVPRLIIEHNIHGVDIDPRAAQIAALSLWLRAQKSWKENGVNPADRPEVLRSNIVSAEPMPGSPEMLKEFVGTLDPPELGDLVEAVFDKMRLAGEAGSLLKIEEDIRTTIATAKARWTDANGLLLGFEEDSEDRRTRTADTDFWTTAERRVVETLAAYAEQSDAGGYQRRLFSGDSARGFAFIDLSRKRYDVAVMNPPFGDWSTQFRAQSKRVYPNSYTDILAAFVERGGLLLNEGGRLGAITSRTCFFLSSFSNWRDRVVLGFLHPELLVDLGYGVMDAAMVEAAAYVLSRPASEAPKRRRETNK